MVAFDSLLSELRRRRVIRVAVGYCAAALLVIEAANNIFPALGLPAWTTRLVVVLAIVGLPAALLLAWAFDVTPDGLKRTDPAPAPGPAVTVGSGRRWRALVYVAVVVLGALLGGGAYAYFRRGAAGGDEERSIAVLPFVNMSADRSNDYFSDGIAEEILDALTHVPGLRVSARTSSFAFKGKSGDVGAIAARLHVTHILEGSVQKEGGRVRITAQLVDARTGYHLWSEKYTRELKDVFALEDEISKAIAGQLQVSLAAGAVLARTGTRSEEAHDLYLRGRQLFIAWTAPEGSKHLLDAIDLYRRALTVDSSYAAAWSGIADAYTRLADNIWEPHRAYPLAREAALKALALDSTLAEAHASLGLILLEYDWDLAAAAHEARKALALNASSASAHYLLGLVARARGQWPTAARETHAALQLDPDAEWYRDALLSARLHTGDGPGIVDSLRALVRAHPRELQPLLRLAVAAAELGDLEELRADVKELRARFGFNPERENVSPLAAVYLARLGDMTSARVALGAALRRAQAEYVPASYIAADYAALGDRQNALAWLERAHRERDALLLIDAALDLWTPLRGEARYQAVRRATGLP